MKQLLADIVLNIATMPNDVKIDEHTDAGTTTYTITVHPDDMGRIIGKSGKVIKAIRSLAHVVAIRQNTHFRINVAEVSEAPGHSPKQDEITTESTADATEASSTTNDEVVLVNKTETDKDVLEEVIDPADK